MTKAPNAANYHQTADRYMPVFRGDLLRILRGWRESVPQEALFWYVSGAYDASAIVRLIDMNREQEAETIGRSLTRVYALARGRALADIAKAPTSLREAIPAVVNPEAVAFLERYALDQVTGLTDDLVPAIRDILLRGQREGLSVDRQARLIRDVIGLTPRMAAAVANVEATIYAEGIASGMYPEAAEKAAKKAADAYSKRALRERAETIARTETIRAQNAGQVDAWKAAINRGDLRGTATKMWIVTPDDRLDKRICRPMAGVKVGIHEEFNTPAGAVEYPPAHPRCRCAVGIGSFE